MTTIRTKDNKRYIQRPFAATRMSSAYVTVRDVPQNGPIARCVEITVQEGDVALDAVLSSKDARELAAQGRSSP